MRGKKSFSIRPKKSETGKSQKFTELMKLIIFTMPCQGLFIICKSPTRMHLKPRTNQHINHIRRPGHIPQTLSPSPKQLPCPFAAQKTAHRTPKSRLSRAVLDLKDPLSTPDSKPATQPPHLNSRRPNPPPSESASPSQPQRPGPFPYKTETPKSPDKPNFLDLWANPHRRTTK